MKRPTRALDAAAEIARLAGVPLDYVFAYFSFGARLPLDVQSNLGRAANAVIGLGRDRKTRKLESELMKLADFRFETELGLKGPFVLPMPRRAA